MKRTSVFARKSIRGCRNLHHGQRYMKFESLEARAMMAGDTSAAVAFAVGMPAEPPEEAVSAAAEPIGAPLEVADDQTAPLFTNPVNRLDVDDDGRVTSADAVSIIADLNVRGPRRLSTDPTAIDDPANLYVDVNGDGFVSPMDALAVVNYLNGSEQEQTEQAISDKPFTNPADPLDVDGSGLVTIRDVDLLMQELNRGGPRALDPKSDRPLAPPFFDVNGDGFLSPHDALALVNQLKSVEASEADLSMVDYSLAELLDSGTDALLTQLA